MEVYRKWEIITTDSRKKCTWVNFAPLYLHILTMMCFSAKTWNTNLDIDAKDKKYHHSG